MPAKKKLTKKKPAAKAAQPSSKKRPMPTKAEPATKKKKPAAKKPARRPFHEGGMIDMELEMLENMARDAMAAARGSVAGGGDPRELDQIFDQLSMGIAQVRDINQRGMDRPPIDSPRPRPNPNVPRPQITPEQEQAVRAMNQARFMRPDLRQPPRKGTNPEPITTSRPRDPNTGLPIIEDRAYPSDFAPTGVTPTRPNIPRPIFITPEEQARRNALENNRNPQRTGPSYNRDPRFGGRVTPNYTPGPRPTRERSRSFRNNYSPPTPMGPRAGGAINPNPTRVPFNQPPMDRRPRRLTPDPVTFDAGGKRVIPDFAKPSMDRIKQQQAMRAMNQARFATPRPMNRGGMVARPRKPIHPDMPASFGQVQPNKPTGRR